jgi:hypothetical protein
MDAAGNPPWWVVKTQFVWRVLSARQAMDEVGREALPANNYGHAVGIYGLQLAQDNGSNTSEKPRYIYTDVKTDCSLTTRKIGDKVVHRSLNNHASRKAMERANAKQVFLPVRKGQAPVEGVTDPDTSKAALAFVQKAAEEVVS